MYDNVITMAGFFVFARWRLFRLVSQTWMRISNKRKLWFVFFLLRSLWFCSHKRNIFSIPIKSLFMALRKKKSSHFDSLLLFHSATRSSCMHAKCKQIKSISIIQRRYNLAEHERKADFSFENFSKKQRRNIGERMKTHLCHTKSSCLNKGIQGKHICNYI